VPDTSKLRALIGFTPQKTLEDVILDVAAHLKNPADDAARPPSAPNFGGDAPPPLLL
jgi:hypothetical protein